MCLPAPSWSVAPPVQENLASDVFVGCLSLRLPGPKRIPYVLGRLGVLHYYTVVMEPSAGECMYFDFLPANPESPLVAAAALTGQRVKGIVQERQLRRPPSKRCWWVGKTEQGKGLKSAREFNKSWDSRLLLFRHDCRHHTDGLVQHLTGKKDVTSLLDRLGRGTGKNVDQGYGVEWHNK